MNLIPFYHKDVCSKIDQHGLRLGDCCEIFPAVGRKKVINLNRTSYQIETKTSQQQVIQSNCSITIPLMSQQQYQLEMTLIPSDKEKTLGEGSRFLLQSKIEIPFRINGIYSFKSFVERGDVIEFGYHRIKMSKKSNQFKKDQEIASINEKVLKSMLPILIEGETGTGKTYLAKKIHERSGRGGRFVHLNLSSFSKNLIESELFGHKKGAFTGAVSDKCGAIEEAHYGTLFLDEIDSLSTELQTKLLLFLDNGSFRKVGGEGEKKSDVRIIFASGSHLKSLVLNNLMRKDFYFRISSGIEVLLKPLRLEPERIKELCYDFSLTKKVYFSESLIELYSRLKWPGNIRQLLGHLNKKLIIEGGDKIIWSSCDDQLENYDNSIMQLEEDNEVASLEEFKQQYVQQVFRRYEGHIKDTARALKLAPNTVRSMVKKSDAA